MKNEKEILELLLQGKSYTTIQVMLNVSPSSVACVKKKYYDKLESRHSEARDKSITTLIKPIVHQGGSIPTEKKIESNISLLDKEKEILLLQPEKKVVVVPEKKVVMEQLSKQEEKKSSSIPVGKKIDSVSSSETRRGWRDINIHDKETQKSIYDFMIDEYIEIFSTSGFSKRAEILKSAADKFNMERSVFANCFKMAEKRIEKYAKNNVRKK